MDNEIEQQDTSPEIEADTLYTQDHQYDAQTVDWEAKTKELEAENSKLNRQLKRAKKADEAPERAKQSEGLDYGMKAYLKAEGINSNEFDFVQEQLSESNLQLDGLLSNKYFQSELKDRRDKAAIETAMPGNTRGASENPKSKVDYWLSRGEMPENTPENTELRREIVNKRYDREKRSGQFSQTPIIST